MSIRMRHHLWGFPKLTAGGSEGILKVLRINLSLLDLKTETDGNDKFGTCLVLLVSQHYTSNTEFNGSN